MHELVVNLHMHTPYSDGHGTHEEIAQAALRAGVDCVIVTDHNVLVKGQEKIYKDGHLQTLLLVGEEIHDRTQQPQKNHLLAFGITEDMASLAANPQKLVDRIHEEGGLSFLAHPRDPAAPAFGEQDLSWVNWEIAGFTGIELWNAMSEFKSRLKSKIHGLYYTINPHLIAQGPFNEVLDKWDDLLREGKKIVAIGGSDAHAFPAQLGPFQRTIFPYEFHFNTVNTHLLTSKPLLGELDHDRKLILRALGAGHAFVGYDLPASTKGFRFTAQGKQKMAWMGDEISPQDGVTFQIRLPIRAECCLLKDGVIIKQWDDRETCTHITSEPGAYRVEVYIPYYRQRRAWIFSNPIYLR